MSSHLSGGKVNLNVWRDAAQKVLLDCLDKCIGSKAVVWDDQLTGPVGLIAEYSLLKEHEVDKMFPLRPGRLPLAQGPGTSAVQNVIFIVRPLLKLMDIVADCIRKTEETPGRFRKEYHIFFAPRKSLLCTKKLRDLAVYGMFTTIGGYDLELLPMDSDLISMENDAVFKECNLLSDQTSLHTVAQALLKFQVLYGIIPKIYGKGVSARNVADMILRMRQEIGNTEFKEHPQVDYLLLIDRTVDLLTPLATQLTYEGLIDEFFGISNCSAKFPPEKFAKKSDNQGQSKDVSTEPKKIQLNSADELFSILRDKNFNAVGPELSRKAKVLSAQYEERKDAKTVRDIKQFVTKLPHIQLAKTQLATHTSIAELIKEKTDSDSFMDSLQVQQEFMNGVDTDKVNSYIEDCIARKDSLIKVLRLLCMQSVSNNGFKPKIFDYYMREILQTYGYENILTLNNLEKAGLLRVQGPKTYGMIRKTLKLVVEDVNEQNPTDISYVHSGYAPLSVRLAQFLARPGWRSIDEILRLLPGPTVEEEQKLPQGIERKKTFGENSQAENMKVCLVFFLGGVTFSEIAALRFLSQQEDSQVEYIIATTKIINGDNWLSSLMEYPIPSEEDNTGGGAKQSRLR